MAYSFNRTIDENATFASFLWLSRILYKCLGWAQTHRFMVIVIGGIGKLLFIVKL
jgi:hypothetical protein